MNTRIMKKLFYVLLAPIIFLNSCKEGEFETPKGSFTFSANVSNNLNGPVTEEISTMMVTVESGGEVVLENHEVAVNGFRSEPILLEVGSYQVTKFILLNASNEVVYATPKSNSVLANLVSTPLPQSFEIIADEVSNMELEVISTDSLDPEDLGYSSLGYSIVPTVQILVSTLINDGTTTAFAETNLLVRTDQDTIFSIVLADSINVLTLRSDYGSLDFHFTLQDSLTETLIVSQEELMTYRTTPLTIVFNLDTGHSIELKPGPEDDLKKEKMHY